MSDLGRPLWLFLHLPKTGGTTFKAHLERHLGWDEELVEFSYWGRQYRAAHGRAEFAARSKAERNRAVVLAGHRLHWGDHRLVPGREPRYVTFVRDPAERCVSLYNFRRSRGVTELAFEAWYEGAYLDRHRDSMVGFFASRLVDAPEMLERPQDRLETARQLLRRCWHVGRTETLDVSLALLCAAMGIPPDWRTQREAGSHAELQSPSHPLRGERVTRHFVLDPEWRARIYRDNPLDLALYRWVCAAGPSSA